MSRPHRRHSLTLVLLGTALVACGSPQPASAPSVAPDRPATGAAVAWEAWSARAFERARAEARLVVVDAGIEGCTACRRMHEETYRDPAVVRWLSEHAVAVSVDADMQPDIAERFDPWGWPATGVLAPDGTTLWMMRGYFAPPRFLAALAEIRADYLAGKPVESLEPEPVLAGDLETACGQAAQWIDERGDDGGWGGETRVPNENPIRWSLVRARSFQEPARLDRARAQARGTARLLDRVWGGVFVASRTPDYSELIVEKRTNSQTHALASFGLTLAIDPGGPGIAAAGEVDRYLQAMMRARDGLYRSAQRDEIAGLPREMTATDYYRLDDAGRRRHGLPVTDHATYTAENGLLALAYLEVFRASGDPVWLGRARALLDAVLATRMTADGYLRQTAVSDDVKTDPRLRRAPANAETARYLRPQVQVGFALVQLHEATGESRYLATAEALAAALAPLQAPGGGWYSGEPRETDAVLERRTPGFDNAWAARLFNALHGATGKPEYRDAAERALRSIGGIQAPARSEGLDGVAVYALALHEHLLGPIEVTLVGPADDPRAAALFAVGFRDPDPRVVVERDTRGRYPDRKQPAAYVCTRSSCSQAVSSPAELERVLAAALVDTARGQCGAAPRPR